MIIGIDAGTRSMGIAALEDSGELRWSEQLAFKGALNDRLRALYGEIELLMESTYFAWVFIENPPYVQNQRTHATLHQAVGVVKAAVMVAGMVPPAGVRLLSATEIKAAFTGNGKATKGEVQQVVEMRFGIDAGEDEADAIATAYAGYCKLREERE